MPLKSESVVVFDTNILPTRYGLESVAWLMVKRLCKEREIRMCLPDIVVEESVNLRGSAHEESARILRSALADIEKNYQALSAYVPDRSEVEEWWRKEIVAFFDILPSNGEDAVEALVREARRQRPAREGRGSRDSLIWLATKRELRAGKSVSFVSNNTKDFGGRKGDVKLHPELQEELPEGMQVELYLSLESFIASLATSVGTKLFVSASFVHLLQDTLYAEIYSKVSESDIFSSDYDLLDFRLNDARARVSYSIDGTGLCLATAGGAATLTSSEADTDIEIPIKVRSWIEFDPLNSGEPILAELQSIELRTDEIVNRSAGAAES